MRTYLDDFFPKKLIWVIKDMKNWFSIEFHLTSFHINSQVLPWPLVNDSSGHGFVLFEFFRMLVEIHDGLADTRLFQPWVIVNVQTLNKKV